MGKPTTQIEAMQHVYALMTKGGYQPKEAVKLLSEVSGINCCIDTGTQDATNDLAANIKATTNTINQLNLST